MHSATTWFDLYLRRNDWAIKAYEEFLQGVASELSDSMSTNEQVTVAVYGATQVGKTTLILELMGLGALTTDEVASVLRGGQKLGKSATAMPIRYGRSQDDAWYIGGNGPLERDSACAAMKNFRERVDSGEFSDAEVLDIRIPARLFPGGSVFFDEFDLNVIDIPGINSHNENEQRLVKRLAERYVAVADIVLLVGRADKMGFLNKEDLILPALSGWKDQPSRFRIALTFGFSNESVLKHFKDSQLTVESVRQFFMAETATHDYGLPEEFRKNLFVLEMGDSVAEIARTNPEYHERIMSVSSEVFSELRESIAKAAGPYSRLYSAFQLDRVISARRKKLVEKKKESLKSLKEQRAQFVKDLGMLYPELLNARNDEIGYFLVQLEEEIEDLERKRTRFSEALVKVGSAEDHGRLSVSIDSPCERRVQWLKKQLESLEEKQKEKFKSEIKWFLPRFLPEDEDEHGEIWVSYSRKSLLGIENILEGYKTDRYFWSSFTEDRQRLEGAFTVNASDNWKNLRNKAELFLSERKSSIETCVHEKRIRAFFLSNVLDKLEGIVSEGRSVIEESDSEIGRMKYCSEWVSGFESRINLSFSAELGRVMGDVYSNPIPANRFLSIFNAKLLMTGIDRFYEGKPA